MTKINEATTSIKIVELLAVYDAFVDYASNSSLVRRIATGKLNKCINTFTISYIERHYQPIVLEFVDISIETLAEATLAARITDVQKEVITTFNNICDDVISAYAGGRITVNKFMSVLADKVAEQSKIWMDALESSRNIGVDGDCNGEA